MDATELLWQRDTARASLMVAENENRRLKMLLRYAEEAIAGEHERAQAALARADRGSER